jgi:hypothetical protein
MLRAYSEVDWSEWKCGLRTNGADNLLAARAGAQPYFTKQPLHTCDDSRQLQG